MVKNSQRAFVIRLNAFEDSVSLRMAKAIRKEKNRYIDAQIVYYRRAGMLSPQMESEHFVILAGIYKVYITRLFYGIVKISLDGLPELKSRIPIEKKLSTVESYLERWFRLYSASKIKKIAGTTTSDLRRLMKAAFDSGLPEKEVIKAGLLAKQISAFRADTIARTETGVASSYASSSTIRDMAESAGVTLIKTWVSVNDDRTRDHHAEVDGSKQPDGKPFFVGGEYLDRPKDPSGSAHNVINCRCAAVWETDF